MPNSATPAFARRGAVFAPGHLGELTRQVPFELVDAVLAETRTRRAAAAGAAVPGRGVLRVWPLRLFPGLGTAKVWASCSPAARSAAGVGVGQGVAGSAPPARRGAGEARCSRRWPARWPAHTPGVRFGRYRTVAFDGCVSIKVPDTDRNRSWLGKLRAAPGVTGYPVMRLMTVVETGTRALLGAVFGRTGDRGNRLRATAAGAARTGHAGAGRPRLRRRARSSPSWPAPARSSWPGCARPARCRYWPAATTARTCPASAS